MFDRALIRRVDNGRGLTDLGRLAEALLYYSKVQLSLNSPFLAQLVNDIGKDTFSELVDSGRLDVTAFHQTTGVQREESRGIPTYRFVLISFAGSEGKVIKSPHTATMAFIKRNMDRTGLSARDQKRILERVSVRDINRKIDIGEDVFRACEAAIENSPTFCDAAAQILIRNTTGKLLSSARFRPIRIGNDSYTFDTNIDFSHLNQTTDRKQWLVKEENVLAYLFETQLDLALAASYQASLMTIEGHAKLLEMRTNALAKNAMRSVSELQNFKRLTLPDLPSVSEAINSGERSFSDFLKVLEKADKFKRWLADVNPDENIVTEYMKEITKPNFFDKLPGKTARFSFFAGGGALADYFGAGGLGTVSGLGLSAIDTYFLDKILRGWKPNHFIEGTLKSFVDQQP